jgi:molybdate transport system permease protein
MGLASNVDWYPLWLSLRVASLATLIVIVVGLLIAYFLTRRNFPGRDLIDTFITLPLVLPPTVLGYYLLVVLGRSSPLGKLYEAIFGQPLVFTWQAAVVAAVLHSAPLFIKAAGAALASVDPVYEFSARSLGSPPWRNFFRITLPLAGEQISALAALSFARALGDFGVTIMLAGNIPLRTQTLSVAIYDAVERGDGQMARILVILVSVVAIAILWPANRLSRRVWTAHVR